MRKENKAVLIKALKDIGVNAFNYYKVKGQGEMALGQDDNIKSYCFEIFTNTAVVDKIKRVIIQSVQTGKIGDGIISVSPVEEIVRIRDCAAREFTETVN